MRAAGDYDATARQQSRKIAFKLMCSVSARLSGQATLLNDAVATQDTIAQLAECLLRQADRYRPRDFGINGSDGPPDE